MNRIAVGNIDLQTTLFSGQVFDWVYDKKTDSYSGNVLGDCATLRFNKKSKVLLFSGTSEEKIKEFFVLDFGYHQMLSSIRKADSKLYPESKKYFGLRILRQEPWKASVTFVCSQNNNIPRIRKIMTALRERYGKADAFPTSKSLSKATISDLRGLGLGYRAEYIHSLANNVASGKLDFERLRKMSYEDAFVHLVDNQHGIGPKVADCLLLYGMGKMEAFPVDVWVRKAVERRYGRELRKFTECQQCKAKEVPYQIMGSFARKKFGKNAGYAQQFLFLCERNLGNIKRKW